jgi:hypothetical protein
MMPELIPLKPMVWDRDGQIWVRAVGGWQYRGVGKYRGSLNPNQTSWTDLQNLRGPLRMEVPPDLPEPTESSTADPIEVMLEPVRIGLKAVRDGRNEDDTLIEFFPKVRALTAKQRRDLFDCCRQVMLTCEVEGMQS